MDQARFTLDVGIKSVSSQTDGSLLLRGFASVFTQDRDRETVQPEAIKKALDGYMQNPILLWQHNAERPIGFIQKASVDAKGLLVDAVVPAPPPGSESWHVKAYADLKAGLVRCFSIGGLFQKIKSAIVSMDLMEISCVSVPAHPSAIFEVVQKAFNLKAMPAGVTPVDSEDGDPPEGSYEDLIADLCRAVCAQMGQASVLATFPDYCIVAVYPPMPMDSYVPMPMGGPDYFKIAYTLDDMGEPVLGESVEVQRMYVPGADADDSGDGKAIDLRRLARKAIRMSEDERRILYGNPDAPRPRMGLISANVRTLPAENDQTLRLALARLDADFDAILAR